MYQLKLCMMFAIIFAKIISAADSKKYCIHMDINKTIIALDTAQKKDIAYTVNEILADHITHTWDNVNKTSYANFVIEDIIKKNPNIIRGSNEMKKIKQQIIEKFSEYLLENHKDIYAKYQENYQTIIKIISNKDGIIFPSFYKLISWLDKHHSNEYSLYLRTFGNDLDEVIKLIEEKSNLKFNRQGSILQENVLLKTELTKISMNLLISLPGHYALQDDYKFWEKHKFQAEGGKLFPLNDTYISIFFDDNADGSNDNKWIIRPIKEGVMQSTKKLIDDGIIVPVNTADAIMNEDYFINKLKYLLDKNDKK